MSEKTEIHRQTVWLRSGCECWKLGHHEGKFWLVAKDGSWGPGTVDQSAVSFQPPSKPDEWILCASIYVDTGKADPPRRSFMYPATGLLFSGWRHGDCLMQLSEWRERLTDEEIETIERIHPGQINGSRQGFLTSRGRWVDREEAGDIARAAGQFDQLTKILYSDDIY